MNHEPRLKAISNKNIDNETNLTRKALESYSSGDTESALKFANQSIKINKINDICHNLAGSILYESGQYANSMPHFQQAITCNPQNAEYHYNLGLTLKNLGRNDEALEQQKTALKIDPENIASLNEAGLLYIGKDDKFNAKEHLYRAYKLNPEDITTLTNITFHCIKSSLLNEAIAFAEQVIKLDPDRAEPYFQIGQALILANFFEKGIEYTHISLSKNDINASEKYHTLLMNYLYSDQYSDETIFEEHQLWANKFLKEESYTFEKNKDPNKQLKIGFVSSDFREHSVANFLLPIIQNYTKTHFAFYCYSGVVEADWVSKEIKNSVECWRDIFGLPANEIAQQVNDDNIDILVDLAGHSKGNFIDVFCYNPAPVQFTYLGYPFSTGLKSIDYRISDNYADPVNMTEHLHTERLARISPSFLCYQPTDENIPINEDSPFIHNNYITFGSFNNLNKLSGKTIALWANILKNVEFSMLALKSSVGVPGLLKEHLVAQFQMNGISLDRLLFFNTDVLRTDHIKKYNKIDICLDTYPYNGTTTTFEALWMGVPVITLCGNAHHNRVGNSILQNMGLSDLVATSEIEYINIATALANDYKKIQEYRHGLREKLMSSPLTDVHHFSQEFDRVLRDAWHQYCATTE